MPGSGVGGLGRRTRARTANSLPPNPACRGAAAPMLWSRHPRCRPPSLAIAFIQSACLPARRERSARIDHGIAAAAGQAGGQQQNDDMSRLHHAPFGADGRASDRNGRPISLRRAGLSAKPSERTPFPENQTHHVRAGGDRQILNFPRMERQQCRWLRVKSGSRPGFFVAERHARALSPRVPEFQPRIASHAMNRRK